MTTNARQDHFKIDGWTQWADTFDDSRLVNLIGNRFGDPRKRPVKISAPACDGVIRGGSVPDAAQYVDDFGEDPTDKTADPTDKTADQAHSPHIGTVCEPGATHGGSAGDVQQNTSQTDDARAASRLRDPSAPQCRAPAQCSVSTGARCRTRPTQVRTWAIRRRG